MTVRDLIKKLLELEMDNEIAIASYDENEELYAEKKIDIRDTTDQYIEPIKHGDKDVGYYLI